MAADRTGHVYWDQIGTSQLPLTFDWKDAPLLDTVLASE